MTLAPDHGRTLIGVAHDAIIHGLAHAAPLEPTLERYEEALREPRASFVTLRTEGKLRGCIGGLEARMPLVVDVARHAYAAAFSDVRFDPVTREELSLLEVHVSVLSPLEPLAWDRESALLAALEPGVHGLVIALDDRRATFLPSVWSALRDAQEFLAQLKRKADIDADATGYSAWRYTVQEFD